MGENNVRQFLDYRIVTYCISGNRTCVQGKCFHCDEPEPLCPKDGILETSVAYWIPRHLKLFTYPPKYMPYSTPRMEQ